MTEGISEETLKAEALSELNKRKKGIGLWDKLSLRLAEPFVLSVTEDLVRERMNLKGLEKEKKTLETRLLKANRNLGILLNVMSYVHEKKMRYLESLLTLERKKPHAFLAMMISFHLYSSIPKPGPTNMKRVFGIYERVLPHLKERIPDFDGRISDGNFHELFRELIECGLIVPKREQGFTRHYLQFPLPTDYLRSIVIQDAQVTISELEGIVKALKKEKNEAYDEGREEAEKELRGEITRLEKRVEKLEQDMTHAYPVSDEGRTIYGIFCECYRQNGNKGIAPEDFIYPYERRIQKRVGYYQAQWTLRIFERMGWAKKSRSPDGKNWLYEPTLKIQSN